MELGAFSISLTVKDIEASRTFYEKFGFEVIGAMDGEQALSLVSSHKNDLVACVLDVSMPKLNGFEVFIESRKFLSNLPVLFMSGYSSQAINTKIAESSNVSFIKKPFRVDTLAEALQHLIPSAYHTRSAQNEP